MRLTAILGNPDYVYAKDLRPTIMKASALKVLPDASLMQSASGSLESVSQRRLLLMDEQAHVLRVMRLNFDRHGYEVDAALGSSVAIQLLQDHQYDALIITSDMPDFSAREMCEFVVQTPNSTVPLILVCEEANDSQWIENISSVELIDSPISLRWIVARLSEAFGDYERSYT